jgi:hypothetical protein
MAKKSNLKEFIKKVSKLFEYDFSKFIYINSRTKSTVICSKHGEFLKSPNELINSKAGCPYCSREKQFPNKISNKEDFILMANKIHNNKYDYSKVEYNGYKDRNKIITIICPNHGEFHQRTGNHLTLKQGCPKCYLSSRTKTKDYFINQANQTHNNKYDYSKVVYINSQTKVCIICPKHGEFWQTPASHINKEANCPFCKKNISKGEIKISLILQKYKIKFIPQFCFEKCKGIKNKLPFDFFLPEYNSCIEFDGRQHFEPVNLFGGKISFKKIQKNDKIKNQFCLSNNINLIRMPYNIIRNNKKVEKFILDGIDYKYIF